MDPPRTRGQGKMTIAVKSAVEQAFKTVNGKRNGGLIKLAKDHPAIFYGLVAKCIPSAVALSVEHHIDLGALMLAAEANLQRLAPQDVTPKTIDATAQDLAPITQDVTPITQDLAPVEPGVERVTSDVVQPRISRRARKK